MISPAAREGRTGRLGTLYGRHRRPDGLVDNILRVSSLNPETLEHHVSLYGHLMRGASGLSLAERELIAVAVSVVNDCHY